MQPPHFTVMEFLMIFHISVDNSFVLCQTSDSVVHTHACKIFTDLSPVLRIVPILRGHSRLYYKINIQHVM